MSPQAPARVVVRLRQPRAVAPAGQVALEDYARALTGAAAATALVAEGDGSELVAVVLEAPLVEPQGGVLDDIEAFARDLAESGGLGLGWS